jgi:hypothetical protein
VLKKGAILLDVYHPAALSVKSAAHIERAGTWRGLSGARVSPVVEPLVGPGPPSVGERRTGESRRPAVSAGTHDHARTGSAPVGQVAGRWPGPRSATRRWVRIFRMTTGSSMVATTRMRSLHRAQASTSTANVRRNSSGHDHLRAAGGGEGASTVMVRGEPGSRPAARLDDPGALEPRSIVTTKASRRTVLASGPPADPDSPRETGRCALPHATTGAGEAGVSRP